MVDPEVPSEPLLSTPGYRPPETMNATTRHLCAAPYVDVTFADDVIREVVESERKAVPPSYGFDIDPVVRHSLRARRLLVLRYALVTFVLIVGYCLSPLATFFWLLLCGFVVAVRSRVMRALAPQVRWAIVAAIVVVGFCSVAFSLLQSMGDLEDLLLLGDRGNTYSGSGFGDGGFSDGGFGLTVFDFLYPLLLASAMFAVLFLSRRHVFGIITTELAPGTPTTAPRSTSPRVERRLAVVAGMQRGNIAVHDQDPFLGAGWFEHGWEFAITLDPAERPEGETVPVRVHLDGAELNRRVSKAILDLRSERLGDGEKIPNVFVVPYVAADGWRRTDDPLVDPATRTPYTMASLEACPQGGMRHYLRAVVPAHGKEVRTPQGRPVLPAQDSGVAVTAFVHLALEGGLLYAEFVATVMPEVRRLYQLGDILKPERVPVHAAETTLRHFFRDNLFGVIHLARIGWNVIRLQGRMSKSARDADEFRFYDYGADLSVREHGSDWPTGKYMHHLDAAKYIALLDKAVTQSILDFLDEHGVNTTEFRAKAASMSFDFSTKTFHGGQQVFGSHNRISQTNIPKTPRGGAGG
jgi:hypothetical protein